MGNPDSNYDLIVVGLGAVGSAALYHASEMGLRVLGIDRHHPPHDFGSSHAETRITRLAVGEGPQYLPFVRRAHEIWRDLESKTGSQLLFQTGGYIITMGGDSADERWGDFVTDTAAVADAAGIEFEVTTPDALMQQVPTVRLDGSERVGFEPNGGFVLCERAIATQLGLARERSAEVLTNSTVTDIRVDEDRTVAVAVGEDVYTASSAIVATGAWFAELAPAVDAAAVSVTRQVVYWLEVEDPEPWGAARFPFLIWSGETIDDYLGAFPMPPGGVGGLKLVSEQFSDITTAESVSREVTDAELRGFYDRCVQPRLTGVLPSAVKTSVCLYTNTPDDDFLIDSHPHSERVLFASPCSGHGFKHSTALAEAMVQRVATGESALATDVFARRW